MTLGSDAFEWPPDWELTAPESHVLSYQGSGHADEPFKLAVKELVARRVLRVERVQRRRLLGRKAAYALCDGPLIGRELAPPLAPVLSVYRGAHRQPLDAVRDGSTVTAGVEGVLVADLAKAARGEFRPIDRYREQHVVPALVRRGLLVDVAEHAHVLTASGFRGILKSRPDYRWTPAGREADCQLEKWLSLGRHQLSRWSARDIARGAAYAEGAGAALLLMPDLYPELERFAGHREGAVGGGAGGGGGEFGSDTGDDFDTGPGGLDPGGLDLDFGGLGGDFGGVGDLGGFGGCGGGCGGGGGGGGCGGGG